MKNLTGRHRPSFLSWVLLGALTSVLAGAQDPPEPEEIIARFAAKEAEFQKVWQQYTFVQNITFQVLGNFGQVREQRDMVIEVYFTRDGNRQTRVLKDRGQLRSVGISSEDLSDATSLQPFVLTTQELPNYRIEYRGRERVDELDTYIFDVEPRNKKKGKRYFQGRIWVDDVDYQIVMTRGKAVPDYRNNKFPEFETVREQIDGIYWFPTWTKADDILEFGDFLSGQRRVRVRQIMTYEDFKKFEVETTIRYEPPQDQPPSPH